MFSKFSDSATFAMFYKTMLAKTMLVLGVIAMLFANAQREADASAFDFKDPKSISAISLTIDSMLEPIVGWAKGISGNVNFDPKNPLATTGKIAVDVSSVQFANEGYTATARGFALNGAKYPQIFFTLRKVLRVTQPTPDVFKATVQADFTCRGVTVPLTVPVTASYFPGKAEERTNGQYKGDILVLRTNFSVSRSQYGISEGIPENLVGDKIEVRVAVVGIRYAPETKAVEPQAQTPPTVNGGKTPAPDGSKTSKSSGSQATASDSGSGVSAIGASAETCEESTDSPMANRHTCLAQNTLMQEDRPLPAQMDQPVTLNITLPEIRANHSANTVTLSDWNRDKTRVLFFFSEQCGVTYFYKQRLQQIQKDFEGKGFAFLGIRCGRREKPDAPITLAEAGYLKMTFVDDANGSLADQFQVKQSLTFAVLDPNGKLRYRGGFDDNVTEKRVQKSYLRQALGELAAGKPVTLKVGKAIGCAILPVHETK